MTLMKVIAALLLLGVGGLVVGAAVLSLFHRSRANSWRLVVEKLSAVLVVYGGVAFFGQALAATGVLFFLGPSFEWPVGYAWGVVSDSAGVHRAADAFREDPGLRPRGPLRLWLVRACGGWQFQIARH